MTILHDNASVHYHTAGARSVTILPVTLHTSPPHTATVQGVLGTGYPAIPEQTAGAVGSGSPSVHYRTALCSGQWASYRTLLHYRGHWVWVCFSTLSQCRGKGAV